MIQHPAPPAPPVRLRPPRRSAGWRWPLRLAAPLVTALLWTQPLLIGLFLAGQFDRLAAHAAVGGILVLVVFVQFLLAVPAWRPGGMPGWVLTVAAAMVAGAGVQIAAGYQRNLGLHVPLGVTLAAAGAAVTIGAWWPASTHPTPKRPNWMDPTPAAPNSADATGTGHR